MVDAYLQSKKNWAVGDYCLVAAGADAESVAFRAVHRKSYERPVHPGANEWDIALDVEIATGIVSETGEE